MQTAPHISKVRVRYVETDQMGIAHHSNHLVWMEVARVETCRDLGFDYREMEQDGMLLAVAEAHCRYISGARYDDEISIETTITEASRRFVSFEYEMTCEGRRIASGKTRHIFLNKDLRPTRLTDKYAPLFGLAGDQKYAEQD